jgi:drug/metabolite transporter (DMT)-like permease
MLIEAVIYNSSPIFTAILGYLLLKERITSIEFTAIFVAFIGVVVLVYGEEQESETTTDSSDIRALILLLCCPILIAIYMIALRH